jgi:hypothetical protein
LFIKEGIGRKHQKPNQESPLGANAGKKMNTKILQIVLALLISATAIKIWMDIL